MIKTAYLRVYVPAGSLPSLPRHLAARRRPIRATEHFVWDEPTSDDAFLIDHEGTRYVCPRFPWLRMLEGLVAFTNAYPGMPLLPEARRSAYRDELDSLRRGVPGARSHILSSPWHVPLRWFAAFMPADRQLHEDEGHPSIRYRGPIEAAVERIAWAAAVLADAGFSEQVVDQVRDLEHWLSEFPTNALLELEYGSVAEMFSPAELALDETCAEVRESLLALERGALDEAGEHYMAAATRWSPAQALTYSN